MRHLKQTVGRTWAHAVFGRMGFNPCCPVALAAVLFFSATMAFAALSSATAPIDFVQGGIARQIRYEGKPWAAIPGYLQCEGERNVLYGDVFFGGGDATVWAELTLNKLDGNGAGLVINENSVFGFDTGGFFAEGRMFGLSETVRIPGGDQAVKSGQRFRLEMKRRGDTLTFSIDGTEVWTTPFDARWLGEVGLRPWRAAMKVHEFGGAGRLLSLKDYVLNVDENWAQALAEHPQGRLLQIAPVVLPEDDNLVTNNWHFGWPVATATEDAMLVFFNRAQHHHGSIRLPDEHMSTCMFIRSTDNGKTWSAPRDMRDFVQRRGAVIPGGMRAVGVSPEGAIFYVGDQGLFRSADSGQTWTHCPDVFDQCGYESTYTNNIGPDLIVHPTLGLVFASHVVRKPLNYVDEIWLWHSQDDGRTWQRLVKQTPPLAKAMEPALLPWGEGLIVIGRSHDEGTYEADRRTYRYVQMWCESMDEPLQAAYTTIRTSNASEAWAPLAGARKATFFGLWSQDTVDLSYNPMSKRFEVVATNRTGGGAGQDDNLNYQTLNLWSIDPEALMGGSATWRFEGTLLRRHALDVTKFIDGMHPAGSVIDKERGVQHIFVYLGYYHGPAGVFRITRSLDTDQLSDVLKKVEQQ